MVTTEPNTPKLGFTFRLAGGAGKLSLADETFFGWLRIERLELDVPNLPRPIDLAAGPEIFQRHRTHVRVASLRIQQRELDRFVSARASRLAELGIDQLQVRCCDGHIAAECRVREGPHVADLVFRVLPSAPDRSRLALRLVIAESQIYGFLPTPAPLVAHRALEALVDAEPDATGPRVCGLGVIEVDPLPMFLWATLPPAGWRLPATRDVALIAARATRSSLQITYGPAGDDGSWTSGEGEELERILESYRDAEERLRLGDIDGAIRAYRGELGRGGRDQSFVTRRLLAIAASNRTYFVDATELARQTLGREPDSAPALAALAAIAVGEDDWAGAADRYGRLAEVEAAAGDEDAAVRAAMAGARLLRAVDPPASTPLYERVLSYRPRDGEAAEALAERYTDEGRWQDLVRLIRSRLAASSDPAQRCRDHVRLAEILDRQLSDPAAARRELEQALAIDPEQATALEAVGRLAARTGDLERATGALDEAARLYAGRGDHRNQARALAEAAGHAASAGSISDAERRYRQALEIDPENEDALSGAAAVLEERGAADEAVALWQRLIESASPAHLPRYYCELGRSLLSRGDLADARAALAQAAESPDPEIQALARSLIARVHEAGSDSDAAAGELAEAVSTLLGAAERAESDRAASLRHRAASLALSRGRHLQGSGRDDEALEAFRLAHSLAGPDEREVAAEAGNALLAAARAAGDAAGEAAWLASLLELSPPPAERARLLLARAELAVADERTEDAIADIDRAIAQTGEDELRAEALAAKAAVLEIVGEAGRRASALSARAELCSGVEEIEAEAEASRAWLDAHDAQQALEAARRALAAADALADDTNPAFNRAVDLAHDALADAAWRRRAWDDVVRGSERLIDAPGDPETIARRRTRYGTALARLGRTSPAIDALERALEVADAPPGTRGEAARELAELHQRAGDPGRAAAALELFATDDEASSPNTRADAWYRAGDLYRKVESGDGDAERCLESALRLVSDHMPALDALERLKRDQGDFERVAVILGRKIAATSKHPARQKALLARLAQIQHDELGRADAARAACHRALEIDPDFRPALRFCAADAERAGDLDRASELYDRLSLFMPGDDQLAEDAIALTDQRTHALRALVRVHRAREDWSSLADALARLSAVVHARGDDEEAARLRDEARALSGEPSSPAAHAQAASQLASSEARELGPDEVISLAKNYRQLERERDAIDLLEGARERAALNDDGELLLFALHRDYQRKLDRARALEDEAEEAGASEAALARLRGALHLYDQSLGDEAGVARVRARMAEITADTPDDDSAAIAHRHVISIGERARELARGGRSLDPVIAQLLDKLRTGEGDGGHHDTLVEGLMTAAAVELDPEAAASLLREAAGVMRVATGDPEGAADALGRALALTPRDSDLIDELDTLLRGLDDVDRLVAAHEQHLHALEGASRAPAMLRLARIHHELTGDAAAAGDLLTRAHDANPSLPDVWLPLASYLVSVGDLRGARALYRRAASELELAQAERDAVADAIDALDDELASEPESEEAQAADEMRRGAELERRGQPEAAIGHYQTAAVLTPQAREPLAALERLYAAAGQYEALGEVLGRLINQTADGAGRAALWRRRAHIYRDILHREAETYRCLKEAFANAPDDGGIAHELRAVAMVRGEWALAAELLYAEIAAAADREEAGALHHELALIFDEKLLDTEQARINYEQALALDPEIPAAPKPLARLYELAGNYADAARMGELAAERARDDDERGRLYRRAAVCAERAGQEEDARRLYNVAALSVGDDEDSDRAQAALARLSSAASDSFSSSELLELRLTEETDPERRVDLLREVLEAATEAGDREAANRYARMLFEADPTDASAYPVLREISIERGDWDGLAAIQDIRAAATRDSADRATRFYELGRLYLDQLDDVNAAVAAFEQALAAQPKHAAALEAVAAVAYGKADWSRARELYAQLSTDQTSMSEDALWYRRGEIAEALGREAEALADFERATQHNPSNRPALRALARAAKRLGEQAKALAAMSALVELLPPDDVRAINRARLELGELYREVGDLDQAADCFSMVLAEDPRSRPALRATVELSLQRGAFADAARALATLAALAGSPAQQAELLYRLGELYRIQLEDPDLAGDSYLKAIDLEPTHAPTLRRLIDYFWRIEDDEELADIASDLAAQRALVGTDPLPLARALLACGLTGRSELVPPIADALAPETAAALADVLAEVSARRPDDVGRIASAAGELAAAIAGLDLGDLSARVSRAAPDSAIARALRAAAGL